MCADPESGKEAAGIPCQVHARFSGPASWLNAAHEICSSVQVVIGKKKRDKVVEKAKILRRYRCFKNQDWGVFMVTCDVDAGEQLTLYYGKEYMRDLEKSGKFVCPANNCSHRSPSPPKKRRRREQKKRMIK